MRTRPAATLPFPAVSRVTKRQAIIFAEAYLSFVSEFDFAGEALDVTGIVGYPAGEGDDPPGTVELLAFYREFGEAFRAELKPAMIEVFDRVANRVLAEARRNQSKRAVGA